MKAVIMAGGQGTRLRPLTSNAPKPMMPLGNRPMMEHVVHHLARHGFDDIVVTIAFMGNAIRNYFGDGSEFGVRMSYAVEDTPLGTAGSVRNAMDKLDERFLVISGDVLSDLDLGTVVETHVAAQAMATIGLIAVDNPLEFGIVITREDGSIERFLEKPTWGQVFSDTINTGIFMLEPDVFDYIEPDVPVDFSSEVFPALLDDGKPLFGAVCKGYWEDVGTLDAYVSAHTDIMDQAVDVDVPGFKLTENVWLGDGAVIHPDAVVDGPAIIGDNCKISAGARLGPYAVLGDNVRLAGPVDIERSVVHDNAYLGEGVRLRGAVVGRSCDLRQNVKIDEGAVLGDECFVGADATIGSEVKIYPFKTVEDGAVVNASIVWESRGARSLFGRDGVAGLANIDITPEFASRLAMAWGSTLDRGDTAVMSRDSSRSARMLKRAMMAGLNAAGVNVIDLEVASVPVTRHETRRQSVAGGCTIRIKDADADSVIIRFFDGDGGVDITEDSQRKIERLFGREDFRRVFPAEIGDILFPPRALERYAIDLERTLEPVTVGELGVKAVVDYAYGSVSFVMPNVLAKLGADVLALNPYASTRSMVGYDREAHCQALADLVGVSGARLGAVIDPDGEHLAIVDDRGTVLSDAQALLLFLTLAAPDLSGRAVALPVSAPQVVETLLAPHNVEVRYTKLSTPALMEVARSSDVGFAASLDGGFIMPGFMPAYDATAAFVALLELVARSGRPLSAIVAELPDVHTVTDSVVTPWDQKGLVMRTLIEQAGDRDVDLVDGVRIHHDNGWVLVLPDPEDQLTQIWADAESTSEAQRLADEYGRRITQIIR